MRRMLENVGLKVTSVLLAVLLWFVVAGEKTSEIVLTVPVELQNIPKSLEVVGEAVDKVKVRLRATPAIVRQLGHEDVSLRLDLKGSEEGEHFFHLTEAAVRRPFGVTVAKLSPASISLHLERSLERELPVEARVVGSPAEGYEITAVVSDPEIVRVAGPSTRVAALESVFTEDVRVAGAQAAVTKTVTIGIGDPLVRLQGDPRVEVTVQIGVCQTTREMVGLPIAVRGSRAAIDPDQVTVVLTGSRTVLDQLTPDLVRPYVDPGRRATGQVPVAVELASGTAGAVVHEIDPPNVQLRADARSRPR